MKIGYAIRTLRRSRKLTQKQLAKESGISVTSISHIEMNLTYPETKTLERICTALDTPELVIHLMAAHDAGYVKEYSVIVFWISKKGIKRKGCFSYKTKHKQTII